MRVAWGVWEAGGLEGGKLGQPRLARSPLPCSWQRGSSRNASSPSKHPNAGGLASPRAQGNTAHPRAGEGGRRPC